MKELRSFYLRGPDSGPDELLPTGWTPFSISRVSLGNWVVWAYRKYYDSGPFDEDRHHNAAREARKNLGL